MTNKKAPQSGAFCIDAVNVWTLNEIIPFISVFYNKKISPRKGDYAG